MPETQPEPEDENLLIVEEERVGTSNGYPLMAGERYGKSPFGDRWYCVTRWEDRGNDKIRAVEKEEVSLGEVEEAIER